MTDREPQQPVSPSGHNEAHLTSFGELLHRQRHGDPDSRDGISCEGDCALVRKIAAIEREAAATAVEPYRKALKLALADHGNPVKAYDPDCWCVEAERILAEGATDEEGEG